MRSRTFVPGAVATPGTITTPADTPDIDTVVSAQVIRAPSAVAIADHAVHAHDLVSQGLGGVVTNALGLPVGLNVLNDAGAAALHTVPGAGTTGVQNIAAAQAHVVTGGNPVVAAVPTKITRRTFSLDVSTLLGDLLTLNYLEVGERMLVS